MPDQAVVHFAGRSGDHNDRAMAAAPYVAAAFAEHLGVPPFVVGHPEPALSAGWHEELEAARAGLVTLAATFDDLLGAGRTPVAAVNRCSVALATLPVVARHRPDAVVVWFDGHADLNTPATSTTDFLGGLALSGPLGLWDSGLGAGLAAERAVLAGARDIDPAERELLDAGGVTLVAPGPGFAERLATVVGGRPVFVHVDCDVLEPGTVPTDYRVPDGLTLDDLAGALAALARGEVVGLEVAELETAATEDGTRAAARRLVDAVAPLLAR
ncbi:arginase family protein [Microlunatus flavus]|uniref:Arginase/Nomega-hydroxy-L-arginine amidinohydrolase n=1 Tax=Microlunatus flavus TaxID=1036181 RepID=A0A1H8Z1D9_9ACTN|nr:arginase family protein [Microlunatus flavus]SEP58141.1 arginase/Nomega-hydroxy-L-arginine amidinohydrolase [Microlunatus flavus]